MRTRKFNQLLVLLGVTTTLLANAYPQAARTVMVQSNSGVLLFPTNLWSANASAARIGLSLATHATNPVVPLTSGGTDATNAAAARTNLGLVWGGLTNVNAADFRSALSLSLAALTNTNATGFRDALNIGTSNAVSFGSVLAQGNASFGASTGGGIALGWQGTADRVTVDGSGLKLNASTLALAFGTNNTTGAGITRTNLGLGATWLTNTDVTNFRTAIGLGATNDVTFNDIYAASLHGISDTNAAINLGDRYLAFTSAVNGAALDWGGELLQAGLPISFVTNTHADATRTNLGIPLPALTNTSNVTMMRALAGSTNTNQPYTGTINFSNVIGISVSNGIIVEIEVP